METMGYAFALIAFVWCGVLSAKISKLERSMKEAGIGTSDKSSLKEILGKNLGKAAKIKFENDGIDYELYSQYCIIEDVDQDWVLLKTEKNEMEKLIRIDSVKSIQFK